MNATGHIAELRSLVERFVTLSIVALTACRARDEIALTVALDARDLLMARVAVVTRELVGMRSQIPQASARARFDAELAPAFGLANEAARLNAELETKAAEIRSGIGQQLDRLRHDEGGLSAYATAPLGVPVIDLRR
jgi:hypothetical protein